MSAQFDLFAGDESTRSFPPYLDPEKVGKWQISEEEDRDHVAPLADGLLPVGALGTNKRAFVLRCLGKDSSILGAWNRPTYRAASELCREFMDKVAANRQTVLPLAS